MSLFSLSLIDPAKTDTAYSGTSKTSPSSLSGALPTTATAAATSLLS